MSFMFGPVTTTEAHLAFAGARVHSNNAAEMSAIVEALSFLGAPWPGCPRRALLRFLWFQACCWCLPGHTSCSHARTAGSLLPTVIAESPA